MVSTPPFESLDGNTIYYTKNESSLCSLWKAPADGGEESQVLDSVTLHQFAVSRGVFILSQAAASVFRLCDWQVQDDPEASEADDNWIQRFA